LLRGCSARNTYQKVMSLPPAGGCAIRFEAHAEGRSRRCMHQMGRDSGIEESISLSPPSYLELCWSLDQINGRHMEQVPIPLLSLQTVLHPFALCRVRRTSKSNLRRFASDSYGARSGDSFLHTQRAEIQSAPR
jgi:hypothetical protein